MTVNDLTTSTEHDLNGIRADLILDELASGLSWDDLIQGHPGLTHNKIRIILEYAAELLRQSPEVKPLETDPDQAWFHSPEWQAKERKVDEELASGKHATFSTMDEFISDLKNDEKK